MAPGAKSCQKFGLDYFISFVTDFSIDDDPFEQYLHDNRLKYFPEPLLYFGRAEGLNRIQVFTDYPPHLCDMNPILTPELDMYACCDAQNRFAETNFFFIGNVKNYTINELFDKYEQDSLFQLIKTVGLSKIATFTGLKASEIVKYRKCELCEKLFNSPENLKLLRRKANFNLLFTKELDNHIKDTIYLLCSQFLCRIYIKQCLLNRLPHELFDDQRRVRCL